MSIEIWKLSASLPWASICFVRSRLLTRYPSRATRLQEPSSFDNRPSAALPAQALSGESSRLASQTMSAPEDVAGGNV